MCAVFRKVDLVACGGNYENIQERFEEWGIDASHLTSYGRTRQGLDTSHMLGQAWLRGQRGLRISRRRPIEEYLAEGRRVMTSNLRRRLLDEGLKEHRCEMCGCNEWEGQPIPRELDHINGRRDDNRLENIRLVCPNCHALTPTYRGRNIGVNGRRTSR